MLVGSDLLSDACSRDQLWEIPVWLHYSTILLTSPKKKGLLNIWKIEFDFLFKCIDVDGKERGAEIVPVSAAWMANKATCRVCLTNLQDFLAASFGAILEIWAFLIAFLTVTLRSLMILAINYFRIHLVSAWVERFSHLNTFLSPV